MKCVTGIGGIFFKASDPDKLREWYRVHLGIQCEPDNGAVFKWRTLEEPSGERYTAWSPFPNDTDYFAPSKQPFMINFQVEDLEQLLAELKHEGVDVDPRVETSEFGKFGWIMDPDGNRVELWEPPKA